MMRLPANVGLHLHIKFLLLLLFTLLTGARHYDDLVYEGLRLSSSSPSSKQVHLPLGWASCGDAENDRFHLDGIYLSPDPPKRGKMLEIRVEGTLKEPLAQGRVNYTVHLGVIPLVQDNLSLCDTLQREPHLPQCPLSAGYWNVTHKLKVPYKVPPGATSLAFFSKKEMEALEKGGMAALSSFNYEEEEESQEPVGDRQVVFPGK